MKDDVTKVEISKTDVAERNCGSSADHPGREWGGRGELDFYGEPHYIEMLPIGKYTLHEESAPEGYLIAEDVAFEVKDTVRFRKLPER